MWLRRIRMNLQNLMAATSGHQEYPMHFLAWLLLAVHVVGLIIELLMITSS